MTHQSKIKINMTLNADGADFSFAEVVDQILEQGEPAPAVAETLAANQALAWQYLKVRECRCTFTSVWAAFETFFDEHCFNLGQEEDKTNASIRWLHDLKTRVSKLESVDDRLSCKPYVQHRDNFAQIRQRVDELTEFVMHKFRCSSGRSSCVRH